ncbi:WD40 repeat domain-containing protein [Parenemella sanctibonifatiensis]|uniref:hypothetical protein n=1 Tax=Parenemella sanctibonifatiensis TaxID=2016505 RepID=UPI001184C578|nr:hypothetical protein [Parenemella sanctibonifatiensis]
MTYAGSAGATEMAPLPRRALLAALAAAPVLSACQGGPVSTPSSSSPGAPSPGTPTGSPGGSTPATSGVGECASLTSGHRYSHLSGRCGAGAPPPGTEVDPVPMTWVGPIERDGDTVRSGFMNTVLAWDPATGAATALLAKRHNANPLWAGSGDVVVVPRCDGSLVVSRAGCVVQELRGHAPVAEVGVGDGIVGLTFVGDELVSAGADGTLRRWDALAGQQLAQTDVDPGAIAMTVGLGALVLSWPDRVSVRRPSDFAEITAHADLPNSTGWSLLAGALVGVTDSDPREVVLVQPGAEPVRHPLDYWPVGLCVTADGAAAVWIDTDTIHILQADGQLTEVPLERPRRFHTAWRCAVADGVLYASGADRGMWAFDLATGQLQQTFTDPRTGR